MWPFTPRHKHNQESDNHLDIINNYLEVFGFTNLTADGASVALINILNGYSACETASHIACVAFAQYCNNQKINVSNDIRIALIGVEICKRIKKHSNLIKTELLNNDLNAITTMSIPSESQKPMIDKVLEPYSSFKLFCKLPIIN